MAGSRYEYWHRSGSVPNVIDCLLPTGIYLTVNTTSNTTLASLKFEIWKEAAELPLFYALEAAAECVFVGITNEPPYVQEFYDETRTFGDLRLFISVLQLKVAEGNREEKRISNEINEVCGISVAEFNAWVDPEAVNYRQRLLNITKEVVQFREKGGKRALASYFYPAQLESEETYLKDASNELQGDVDFVLVPPVVKTKFTTKIHVAANDMVYDVIYRCLMEIGVIFAGMKEGEDQGDFAQRTYQNYVLKVCGRESYFLKSKPFIQYKYIRNNLAHKKPIRLTLVSLDNLYNTLDPTPFSLPVFMRRNVTKTQLNPKSTAYIWNCDHLLQVKPTGVMNINCGTAEKLFIRLGVFHGTESLCPFIDAAPVSPSNPRWSDMLTFELKVQNIPRAAKLCVAVCGSLQRKRKDRYVETLQSSGSSSQSSSITRTASKRELDHIALAWLNINLFNVLGELINEPVTLAMWPVPRGFTGVLNPCGQTGPNPSKENAGHITIRFDSINLIYQPIEAFLDSTSTKMKLLEECEPQKDNETFSTSVADNLKSLAKRDPLYELTEQEKEVLWSNRNKAALVPDVLPKFLKAVRWASRDEVAEVYRLLTQWPVVPPVVALELLDCKFPDLEVRKFAIHSLDRCCSDTELERYLLQLSQVLKYEPYLDSPVAYFLLRRGLLNRRIGHLLFWLLKAEMHDPFVSQRFGCILEALCRGSGAYTKALARQVLALGKLKDLSETVIHGEDTKSFINQLREEANSTSLQLLSSPLDCDDTFGILCVNECFVLQSAKKPLWLVWNNPDPLAELYFHKHEIIFKNGDDLRQDMLTLQVVGLMDYIWQNEGLNLRLIPYGCLPTGKNIGVIEVVRNAKTVMAIQRLKGGMKAAMQVDNTALLKWLREINPSHAAFERAVENFAYSCAGYCVATFILGIGDRHPDNIMVNESGQMFHIDFGHFLGHFKKKFGISRERVPFVLTLDFIHVITKGVDYPDRSTEYENFKQLCCSAYCIMRKHANLIIAMFTMMLSTGIPELQSLEDVSYLRNTLAVDKTDEEAMSFFTDKIAEAYTDAWTTKLDWFFHSVRHFST